MILASAAIVDDNVVGIIAILSVFLGSPLAIAYARSIWRQSTTDRPRQLTDETSQRLVAMQQSIDAMAIEIERISEGQRFVTKVLAERQSTALPAGESAKPAARS